MKSLYRRYRPIKLDDIIGQEQVTTPLKNSLAQGKVSHAYLFVGPRGCGKTSVARILAHEVNGFKYELEDDYVDIIEIDGASNRGIDNIRELREKVAIAPTAGKYKVYIIDEVHMLTKEAFNALLKTLEEPPEHVIFIMATTDAYKVPVTITSRAQTYTFKLADSTIMFQHLKTICEKEKIEIDDAALEIVVKRGGGSFRDSLSLLDQISTLAKDKITKALVIDALGLPEDEKIAALINSYTDGDVSAIGAELKELLNSGIKPETLTEELVRTIIENPKPELMPLLAKLPEVKAPYAEAKLLVALFREAGSYHYSSSGLDFSRTSYTGTPAEPPLRGEPVGSVRNIRGEKSNHDMIQNNDNPPAVGPNKQQQNAVQKSDDASATKPSGNSNFSWDGFIEKVRAQDSGIATQLVSVEYDLTGGTLNIYPNKSFLYKTLSRDKNKALLIEAANGLKVVIHETGKAPKTEKDALISKMSDIMGGEVQNDAGGNPF